MKRNKKELFSSKRIMCRHLKYVFVKVLFTAYGTLSVYFNQVGSNFKKIFGRFKLRYCIFVLHNAAKN